ncbi:MAG: FxLYD domain-containing protein [Planctomycetes bacterium]|nr:FxLYD domain-containing protein [Planctomycetota bacterium]
MRRSLAKFRTEAAGHALVGMAFVAALAACTDQSTAPTALEQDESGEMTVSIALSKAASASISRAEVVVSGTGMVAMRESLTVSGNSLTGTVRGIPAGSTRLFTINCYDAASQLVYVGSASAAVVAGQQVTVNITVRPAGGSAGTPSLRVSSTASVLRPTYGVGTTTITGEITNGGSADATGVSLRLRARNSSGAAISEATVSIGTAASGQSRLFTASFSGTCYSSATNVSCGTTYVARAEYTLTYNEGADIAGSITVQ